MSTRCAVVTPAARAVLAASCTLVAPAIGQDAESLRVGEAVGGELQTGDVHAYEVEAGEGHFVFGAANQISVDVVVTVFDETGEQIAQFDNPARGPETFQFETDAAGTYRIEVTPFEDETGEYEISLRRAEPLASTPEGRVDQLMVAYDDPRTPGGVVAVIEGGEVAFARAYGAADLTYGQPFQVDTRTNIGSTSKQFTCYAILLLEREGGLSIEDDVREHIPELPDLGETVRIKHLMSHTSGYREFLNTVALTGRRLDQGDYIDRSEIIAIVQRQPELQNTPGELWNYNNTAFGLLATIVERVGGAPFPEWMRDNVFEPLGMHDTFVRGDSSTIIERSAMGYAPNEAGGWRNAADLGASMGAGGIYTTVGDLAKWVRNYRTGELGGPEIFETMSTRFVLNNGEPSGYGFGLFIDDWRGLNRVHHGGADTAHRSMVMYFPSLDAAVITQSNNAGFNGGITQSVAEAFFEEHLESGEHEPEAAADAGSDGATFDPATFDPGSFDAFAGRYEMEEVPGFVMEFTREEDKYFTQATGQPKLEIVPTSPTSFRLLAVEASVTFHPEDDGSVGRITVHQNGDHPGNRLPDEPYKPSAELMQAYAGRYFCEELETFYDVEIEEEALVIRQRRFASPVRLSGGKDHKFTGGFPIAQAEFEVDEEGNVTALIVGNGRTRGVRFEPFE